MAKIYLKSILLFICFAYAGVGFFCKPAYALEALNYSDTVSTSFRYQLDLFLKSEYDTDSSFYDIAGVDLNNDGILEHVLKRKSCVIQKNECTHIIIAEKKDEILLLSKISARNLMVDGAFSFGVKNLLAFKSDKNDYDFDIYMWSPKEKLYILGTNK